MTENEKYAELQRRLEELQKKHEKVCPTCGTCPTCGRSNGWSTRPYRPWWDEQPYRYTDYPQVTWTYHDNTGGIAGTTNGNQ